VEEEKRLWGRQEMKESNAVPRAGPNALIIPSIANTSCVHIEQCMFKLMLFCIVCPVFLGQLYKINGNLVGWSIHKVSGFNRYSAVAGQDPGNNYF